MVSPITDAEYYNIKMSQTAKVDKVEKHIVKSNENLWKIAKSKLHEGAKKSEIQDYVYQIAKLNNMSSYQSMNNIKINDVLYLPLADKAKNETAAKADTVQTKAETAKKPKKFQLFKWGDLDYKPQNVSKAPNKQQTPPKSSVKRAASKSSPAKINEAKKSQPAQAAQPPKSNMEISFDKLKDEILNTPDEKLSVMGSLPNDQFSTYELFKVQDGKAFNRKSLMLFCTDKNGDLAELMFNGLKDENPDYMDFHAYKNGDVKQWDYYRIKQKKIGTVSKEDYKQIEQVLKREIEQYKQKFSKH